MGVRGGAIHSDDEYLIVESLAERARLSALTILRLAQGRVCELSGPAGATTSDFQALYEMAKLTGGGFTNLPADSGALVDKLIRSEKGFAAEVDEPGDELYVFMLENAETGQIRGTCQIFGMVGVDTPFYSYRISTLTQTSKALGQTFRNEMLTLTTDLEGSSEVGGLFLHPGERAGGLGMLLARSRYLFIKLHRERFAKRVHRRASRRHRRERRLALLGRDRRPLLRNDLPGGGRVQRRPRHPVHRRSDAQDPDLHRHAARERPGGDGRSPPFRPRGDEDARARRLPASTAISTFSTAARP